MLKDDITKKSNYLLIAVLAVFVLIAIRVLVLTTYKYNYYLEESKKPQIKSHIVPANRGTLRDRYNQPLAINRLQYNAAITFDSIRSIPRYKWINDPFKGRIKIPLRRRYIEQLASFMGKRLGIKPLEIEDKIYSFASIFPSTPFVIQENIPEPLYYELKMLERRWPGLSAQIKGARFYPHGKVACNVVGYLGAINLGEYSAVLSEIRNLEKFIARREEGHPDPYPEGINSLEEAFVLLHSLKEKSYSINSLVGKAGIERQFENELRGSYGKKKHEVDTTGHIVRELPDSTPPVPGKRFLLSISSELQAYAERLLTQSEEKREKGFRQAGKRRNLIHSPWIKGGAIVVMKPDTGEILTLASYPRYDPNDFIYTGSQEEKALKQKNINKWLETKTYIGSIWDGIEPLEREYFSVAKGGYYLQTESLTWQLFLEMILAKESAVKESLRNHNNAWECSQIITEFETLLELLDYPSPSTAVNLLYPFEESLLARQCDDQLTISYTQDRFVARQKDILKLKDKLDKVLCYIDHNDDKLLFLDLCRLALSGVSYPDSLKEPLSQMTLGDLREYTQAFAHVEPLLKPKVKELFTNHEFSQWRKQHFKAFLKEKRREEKEAKRYQKPYLEYLQKIKDSQFEVFYKKYRWKFLLAFFGKLPSPDLHAPYSTACRKFYYDLVQTLPMLQTLKQFLNALSLHQSQEFLERQRRFSSLDDPLWGRYSLRRSIRGDATLQTLAAQFYPLSGFGYARSYAYQESAPLGSIFKIITAYEALNQTFDPNHPHQISPLTIIDTSNPRMRESRKQVLGYHLDGKKITRHYRGGRLPASVKPIGKVDLASAFEKSSNIYFSLLASDVVKKPLDLTRTSRKFSFGSQTGIDLPSEINGLLPTDIVNNQTGLYALAIGQHTLVVSPLQTAVMMSSLVNDGEVLKPQIVKLKASIENAKHRNLSKHQFLFKDYLGLIGLNFPFFSETVEKEKTIVTSTIPKKVRRKIEYPKEVKNYLLNSLYRVVNAEHGSARTTAIRALAESYQEKQVYRKVKPTMIGKTATAEIFYRPCLDRAFKPIICNHIWFSAASFKPKPLTQNPDFEKPELVVIVYLRFGDFGKEAAPIAAHMIEKISRNYSTKEFYWSSILVFCNTKVTVF